ncbi:hypothetical protein CC85DRAFT_328161 [Cutaneotrichosporon oleaginosum]|uniref:Uncharacterized protein n=1 Tax=Cutaneotrichosporon oleaginosum TaxID=879819 RepID=A0A0J0XMT5_9TREE|nr:uncharacterized protein CC85DRAFT_328161 [Cutaneotrichosporon oleaginosum]KLT42405.1 hypothetical protein CC85DRAFT_328161 [Cutaneotrichosporon oleaginosum]TXT06924.1 hypothetical protein COLE_06255 [Cutaneotrichosporon oleaginosum]
MILLSLSSADEIVFSKVVPHSGRPLQISARDEEISVFPLTLFLAASLAERTFPKDTFLPAGLARELLMSPTFAAAQEHARYKLQLPVPPFPEGITKTTVVASSSPPHSSTAASKLLGPPLTLRLSPYIGRRGTASNQLPKDRELFFTCDVPPNLPGRPQRDAIPRTWTLALSELLDVQPTGDTYRATLKDNPCSSYSVFALVTSQHKPGGTFHNVVDDFTRLAPLQGREIARLYGLWTSSDDDLSNLRILLTEDLGDFDNNLGYMFDNGLASPSSYANSLPALIHTIHAAGAVRANNAPEIYLIYPRGEGVCYGMLPRMVCDDPDPDTHELFESKVVKEQEWMAKWLTLRPTYSA